MKNRCCLLFAEFRFVPTSLNRFPVCVDWVSVENGHHCLSRLALGYIHINQALSILPFDWMRTFPFDVRYAIAGAARTSQIGTRQFGSARSMPKSTLIMICRRSAQKYSISGPLKKTFHKSNTLFRKHSHVEGLWLAATTFDFRHFALVNRSKVWINQ